MTLTRTMYTREKNLSNYNFFFSRSLFLKTTMLAKRMKDIFISNNNFECERARIENEV